MDKLRDSEESYNVAVSDIRKQLSIQVPDVHQSEDLEEEGRVLSILNKV